MSRVGRAMRGIAIKALQCGSIPQHVGFIMDGNRRYGRKVHVGNGKGYYLGYETLEEILAVCMEMGVKVVTVYAFSIENFKRPPDQVETLMELAKDKLAELCERSELVNRYGIGIRVLGDVALLPEDVRQVVRRAVDLTKSNNRAILNMCFPYTSREELTMATRSLVSGIEAYELDPSDITTGVLENSLYTRSCPPMDILVRTSGEIRLSDFMLWQSSRTCHVEFIDCYWPEFTFWKLLPILLRYQLRACSIAQSRREREHREEVWSSEGSVQGTEYAGEDQDEEISQDLTASDGETSGSLLKALQRNSSESTLVSGERDGSHGYADDYSCQAREKRQRVAEFLTHRGHLPNCPLVQLQ
ncbi:dehydrodolichyl diphosphate synthase [Dissophora ornata]|nr:cis-prenyltransferase [Dissophora ornata]KAI8606055.1 dehydrodolichyl diphosphate synthase [Dissophora ornata]